MKDRRALQRLLSSITALAFGVEALIQFFQGHEQTGLLAMIVAALFLIVTEITK